MRDIKFRGFDEEEGVWRYGSVVSTISTSGESYGVEPFLYSLIIELEYQDKIEIWRYPVKPETVGQYTGLKDKNDKEIYEGDVISLRDEEWEDDIIKNVIVKYEPGSFFVYFSGFKYSLWSCYDYDMEIIGNIHENPEILREIIE